MNHASGSISRGFLRVAAAVPPVRVGDVSYNIKRMQEFATDAEKKGATVVLFPELSVTGYTNGDLFQQRLLLRAVEDGIETLRRFTKKKRIVMIVGVPVASDGKLFNCAAVIGRGNAYGIIPKTYIPGYKEFYEERWFASGRDVRAVAVSYAGTTVPFGRDLLFRLGGGDGVTFGIEICEDLWTPVPPSSLQALAGAVVVFNLSASNELVAKAEYRRELVSQQSTRAILGYVYTSCGVHESTTDVVFGGHAMIAENGSMLSESKRFQREGELIVSDIDLEHVRHDREKTTSFGEGVHEHALSFRRIDVPVAAPRSQGLLRTVHAHPFVPSDGLMRARRSEEVFSIQVAGLAKRIEHAKIRHCIIGISGGLDSTLALLVAVKTFSLLHYPLKNIHCYTMPGFGTTRRTRSNAERLCKALGVGFEEVDITKSVSAHFMDIKQDPRLHDVAYQNAQARYRTMVLMDKANQMSGLVVGTGDLSEIALGWNTFSGDHISHYDVNAGVPKTLVRYLVGWVLERQVENKEAQHVLGDILDTPISPELVKGRGMGITQKTENIIGPYELHDFFLYHFVRWGSSPRKILFLAGHAFGKRYTAREIKKWLTLFISRFFGNQWKRSVMPDGPKVGSVSLSPRGDWRMPSDAETHLWLKDIEGSLKNSSA